MGQNVGQTPNVTMFQLFFFIPPSSSSRSEVGLALLQVVDLSEGDNCLHFCQHSTVVDTQTFFLSGAIKESQAEGESAPDNGR